MTVGHLTLTVTVEWLERWGVDGDVGEGRTAVNPQLLPLPRTFGIGVSPAEKEVGDESEMVVWEWVL